MSKHKKKNAYKPFKFQSTATLDEYGKLKYTNAKGNQETETFGKIYHSMRVSPAFIDLSARQRDLYGVAVDLFDGARNRPKDDYSDVETFKENNGRSHFYLNQYLLCEIYGIYPKGSRRMYGDIQALIEHGFIERVGWRRENGKSQNKDDEQKYDRSIYRYSDKWKEWTPQSNFAVYQNDTTNAPKLYQNDTTTTEKVS